MKYYVIPQYGLRHILSEEGFESIYQGSVILFHWKIELKTKDAAKFLRGVRTEV